MFEGLDETLDRLGGPGALGTCSDSASFLLSFGWLSLALSLSLTSVRSSEPYHRDKAKDKREHLLFSPLLSSAHNQSANPLSLG